MTPHFRIFVFCMVVALLIIFSVSGCVMICPACYPEPKPVVKPPPVPFKCEGVPCAKLDRKVTLDWLERNTPAGVER